MARMVGDVGFDEDIRALFTSRDVSCMRGRGLDLADWTQVRSKADEIRHQTDTDKMPLGDPWPTERKELFARWVLEGCPKRRGQHYLNYFDRIDSETEYEDPAGSGLMGDARVVMPFLAQTWWAYAPVAGTPEGEEELDILREELELQPNVRRALLAVDEMLVRLTREYFEDDGVLDAMAFLDACEQFGRDKLPEDPTREQQHGDHFDPGYHRMDSTPMWFNWAGQLECTSFLLGVDDAASVRLAILSGLCLGAQMDFVFREDSKGAKLGQADPRAPVLPGYTRNSATERSIRRRGMRALRGWDRAVTLIHKQVAAYVD